MNGIEFTYKDGSKESYDPIDMSVDFNQNQKEYILNMANEYIINKNDVQSYRIYDLCELCGHELYDTEIRCHTWGCKNNLDVDNQEQLKAR